ncbi:SDR family NAD(P)-dependent oxidoreductase [Variovorax sp. RA8]|uniref:SDR family NAD(P)-dependent oxidoreductase n=1 Tax=Variovorax sp. (strain JCM 16519 / RA8) TaxID=662548 RepID=UPI0013172F04|nr:SDR family oxidoreductase [Variovorax sp. RA8]VTU43112.1 Cyclopentanol dehydrogenase [Variovorax sp. RA8]
MNTQHQPSPRLAGKTAIVSGATGGIGLEIIRTFTREGAKVIAVDLADAASDAVQALHAISPEVKYRKLDISLEQEVDSFYRELSKESVALDILVNNAGIILGKPLVETTVAEWDRLAAVNGRGTFLMIRGALPLIDRRSGSVVNISSGAALRPLKNLGAYSASKAAVNALTKAAAQEFAPIRFNVICPGPVDTPMPRKFVERLDAQAQAKVFDDLASVRALQRLGRPEEIAAVVLFLASDEASFMTGMELNVDGGKP